MNRFTKQLRLTYWMAAIASLALPCYGQFDPGNGDPFVDPGGIGDPVGVDPQVHLGWTRVPSERLSCETPSLPPSAPDDVDSWNTAAYIAGISAGPVNATTKPTFTYDDILLDPGNHYNSIVLPSAPFRSALQSDGAGVGFSDKMPSPGTGRFTEYDLDVSQRTKSVGQNIAAKVVDDKNSSLPPGASVLTANWTTTYQQTLLSSPPHSSTFGGAFAADITLPDDATFPGASAFSLTTRMVTNGNLYNNNGIVADIGCHDLATIVGAASEGTTDGIDNDNTGPAENLFGNSDVATVLSPSWSQVNSHGNAGITSTTPSGGTVTHQFRGNWKTEPFYIQPLNGKAPTATFIHTLTMIADPGAEITLVPLDNSELHTESAADVMVFQTDYLPRVAGDFDVDRLLTAVDIDLLSAAVRSQEFNPLYDLTGDDALTHEDRIAWVEEHRSTYFGDSNLDGVFDTGDLVAVFQANQFEDDIAGNSTWATGDWDGNGDFDTGDFVLAFASNGFEQGHRGDAVIAVPEPSPLFVLIGAVAAVLCLTRRW